MFASTILLAFTGERFVIAGCYNGFVQDYLRVNIVDADYFLSL